MPLVRTMLPQYGSPFLGFVHRLNIHKPVELQYKYFCGSKPPLRCSCSSVFEAGGRGEESRTVYQSLEKVSTLTCVF